MEKLWQNTKHCTKPWSAYRLHRANQTESFPSWPNRRREAVWLFTLPPTNLTRPKAQITTESENVYIITQISSGRRLSREGGTTPRQAKLWVGLLCRICDWNGDINSILANIKGKSRQEKLEALAWQVEEARLEAIEQTFFVVTGD